MLSGLMSKLTGGGALPTIQHEDFLRAVKDGSCAIVDVREPHEYAAGHVPGARNLPLSQFDPAKLPTGMPVVLICQAGGRSGKALTQAIGSAARTCAIMRPAPAAGARAAVRFRRNGGSCALPLAARVRAGVTAAATSCVDL